MGNKTQKAHSMNRIENFRTMIYNRPKRQKEVYIDQLWSIMDQGLVNYQFAINESGMWTIGSNNGNSNLGRPIFFFLSLSLAWVPPKIHINSLTSSSSSLLNHPRKFISITNQSSLLQVFIHKPLILFLRVLLQLFSSLKQQMCLVLGLEIAW